MALLLSLAVLVPLSSSTPPPAASSVALAFWSSLGVAPTSRRMQRVLSLTAGRAVFDDEEVLTKRMATLTEAVGADAARLMALRSPIIMTSDLENRVPERLTSLRDMLPDGIDVTTLLVRAPSLLMLAETTLEERLASLAGILSPKSKGAPSAATSTAVARVISRSPTLLQLSDLNERMGALSEILGLKGASERASVVARVPSLLAYDAAVLARKLDALRELFPDVADPAALVRKEPQLLTYDVGGSLRAKVQVFEEHLPGIDVRKLLATTPRLLTYDAQRIVPLKLAALAEILPGADLPRLIRHVPQLLEYDVGNTLSPKVKALRQLFHPSAVEPPPPPPNQAQRLAQAKLIAKRRGAMGGASRGAALRGAAAAGGARGGGGKGLTAVGLLRLASLDMAVVERRLGHIAQMLPEVDAVALVSKQPALLRRDVERSLRPRLVFLCAELGEEAAAGAVSSNPRLLLGSWGVLGRLTFMREVTSGGESENAMKVSSTLMAPKQTFEERFPQYRGWLVRQLSEAQAGTVADDTVDVGALEKAHGALLEARWQTPAAEGESA